MLRQVALPTQLSLFPHYLQQEEVIILIILNKGAHFLWYLFPLFVPPVSSFLCFKVPYVSHWCLVQARGVCVIFRWPEAGPISRQLLRELFAFYHLIASHPQVASSVQLALEIVSPFVLQASWSLQVCVFASFLSIEDLFCSNLLKTASSPLQAAPSLSIDPHSDDFTRLIPAHDVSVPRSLPCS